MIMSANRRGMTKWSTNVVPKRLSGTRKCPSPGLSKGMRTHCVLDVEFPVPVTHTLDSNAISRNRASASMIKKVSSAEAEAALRTVEGRGLASALGVVVGNTLGVLLYSMSGDALAAS